jgi:two-component system, OmpR family, sensor histidine kinase VicK
LSSDANGGYYATEKTEIAYGTENIAKMGIKCHSVVRNIADICSDYKGPQIFVEYEPVWRSYQRMKSRGVHMRFIIDIRKDNVEYCKKLLEVGEIRHIEGFNGNWGILDKINYLAPAISQSHAPTVPLLIRISIKYFVDSHQDLFDTLWKKAIPIEQKIEEIEKGIIPAKIETIIDPSEIETKYIHLLEKANNEILLIFPTFNSMHRQLHMGVFQLLKENISQNRDLKIRILSPFIPSQTSSSSSSNEMLKEKIYQEFELNNIRTYKNNVSIRNIEPSISTKSTILVTDRKESLVIEAKDDLKETFSDSVGFGTYSNSTATVLSYVSIFESFWSYSDIVEKLKRSEELQKQFISIASHELRNPIQPIIGLTEILRNKAQDKEQQELQEIVINNAKKLKQITEDVLDVTRIESQSLRLQKENFDLNEMVQRIISGFIINIKERKQQQQQKQFKGSLNIESVSREDIFIFADKSRINQVISNLLNNAIKFTNGEEEEGNRGSRITISIEKKNNLVVVSIKEDGKGIDHEIFPRLFEKFVTKSKIGGTGLGLFISKSIVEAHGGKIWTENNYDGKGATFGFSLPLKM